MLRYRLMALLAWISAHTPMWVPYAIARVVAEFAWRYNTHARHVALINVRQALGPSASARRVTRAARGCIRASAYYYADLGLTPKMDPHQFLAERLKERGFEHITEAHARGTGVIIATLHYGNPEYVAQSMIARGYHIHGLTEPIQPPQLAALYQRLRDSHGHSLIPVSHSSIKATIRHLRAGGVMCIMADRDIQRAGIEVPFLGATARVPTGAVDLARHTGATVVPVITRRRRHNSFSLFVQPPIELIKTANADNDRRVNTTRLMQRFERYLRRDPSQWYVLEEPIWPSLSTAQSAEPSSLPSRTGAWS